MDDDTAGRVMRSPHYIQLVRDRTRFGWILAAAMLVVYYGFIVLIAFNKELLSIPLAGGATTTGIPVGLFVILFTVLITGLYVRHANRKYDELTAAIVQELA